MPDNRCPRCYKYTLRRVVQTNLLGGHRTKEYCTSCKFERDVLIPSSIDVGVLVKLRLADCG